MGFDFHSSFLFILLACGQRKIYVVFQTIIFRFSLQKDAGHKCLERKERKTELKARVLL